VNGLVLQIARGASVAFIGSVRVRVISGSATVLGAVLAPSASSRALHSPAGGAVLALEAGDEEALVVCLRRLAPLAEPDAAADHESDADADAADACALPRLDATALAADALDEAFGAHLAIALVPTPAPLLACTGAILLPDWARAAAEVLVALRERPVVLLCGPRNAGKSTLLRYLANRALEDWETVSVLDCDPGQPELSPPGLLALHALTEPLLGPPHAHAAAQRAPLAARFVGDVTPSADPRLFAAAVRSLVATHAAGPFARAPLFVNTCGWVRGLGLALLAETVRAVRPSQLIELCATPAGARAAADGADAEAECSGSRAPPASARSLHGAGAQRIPLRELGIGHEFGYSPQLHALPALDGGSASALALAQAGVSALSAAEQRTCSLMAYFAATAALRLGAGAGGAAARQWRSPAAWRLLAAALASAPVAVVSLAHVRIGYSACAQLPASELLWALNASLVGLCADGRAELRPLGLDARLSGLDVPTELAADASGDDAASHPAGCALTLLAEPPLVHCLGLGLVRAVDVTRGELHIVTPVTLAQLQCVNTVVRGNLALPASMITGGAQPMAAMPYFTVESVTDAGTGAASMRSRNNLGRATMAAGRAL
jgi:polynucleotide 5'-hydroxyl-kinase GRC3/NOL9